MAQQTIVALLSDSDYHRIESILANRDHLLTRCDSLNSLASRMEDASCNALIVDCDTMNAAALDQLTDVAKRHPGAAILVLSNDNSRNRMSTLFSKPFMRHLIAREGANESRDIQDALACINGSRIDALRHGLADDTTSISGRIGGSADKAPVLEKLSAFCQSFRMHSRLVTMVQGVADELITNAVYNAPTHSDGRRRYATLNRSNPVILAATDQPEFRAECDESTLLLTVTDPFGSLTPDTVCQAIARGYSGDASVINQGSGGAGLGFCQIVMQVNRFLVDIEPGVRTSMAAIINVSPTYRAFASEPKSIHIFNR